VLGSGLVEEPQTEHAAAATITAVTTTGREITADFSPLLQHRGELGLSEREPRASATAERSAERNFRAPVGRQEAVFAIGDITVIPEAKRGGAVGRHTHVVVCNVRSLQARQSRTRLRRETSVKRDHRR
jgi:hypothetical protein